MQLCCDRRKGMLVNSVRSSQSTAKSYTVQRPGISFLLCLSFKALSFFLAKSCKYTIWLFNIAMENHHFLIGKPSINGSFPMAMLNNQRVKWKGTPNSPEISHGPHFEWGPKGLSGEGMGWTCVTPGIATNGCARLGLFYGLYGNNMVITGNNM